MKKRFLLYLTIILIPFLSCNTVDPPDGRTMTLTLEDVSCTEIYLTLMDKK